MASRSFCGKHFIPNTDVSLRDDWGAYGGSTNISYKGIMLYSNPANSDPKEMTFNKNNWMWWLVVSVNQSGWGFVSMSSPLTIGNTNGFGSTDFFLDINATYDDATVTAGAAGGYQFDGWFDNSGGTGTAISTNTTLTIDYTHSIFTNNDKILWAVFSATGT